LQVKRIRERANILKQYPESGRIVPELVRNDIKELIVGNYHIIYKIKEAGNVDILTIFHSARLLINV